MNFAEKILETVAVALITVDPSGRIVFANPAAAQLVGHSPEELEALPITDLLPDWGAKTQDNQAVPPATTAVLREVRCHHKFGKLLALAVRFTPWSNDADGLYHTLAMRDISAEVALERSRRSDERRIAHAVIASKIGIFEVDVINQTSHVSGAWRELMEIGPDEDIQLQQEWLNRIHPDDRSLVQKANQDCIDGKTDHSVTDYRMRSRNGTEWRWMRSDAVASDRDATGKATRLVGAQTDITDSKRAEQSLRLSELQFRSAMEHAPIGKALLAPDGRWLKANQAMCTFLGYTEEQLLSSDFQTVTHPDDLDKDVEHVKSLLEGDKQTYSMDKRYVRGDGKIVWGQLSVALVRDEKGEPLHFISQVVDINEQRQLQRMKRNFVATVSHELRTPVTAISAALALIDSTSKEMLPEKVKKLVSISHQNALRLRLLLDDILDFEQLSSDKMSINLVTADVTNIVAQSIRSNQPFANQFEVDVTLEAPDQALHANVDPDRLHQVMTNLLSNAAKFSHEGGQVEVRVLADGDHLLIKVNDHGIGIPAQYHDSLFQPFLQVAPPDTRSRMGTGLGLSISKQLIEHMGGTIGFQSKEQEGSEFWVRLPM